MSFGAEDRQMMRDDSVVEDDVDNGDGEVEGVCEEEKCSMAEDGSGKRCRSRAVLM